MKMEKPSLPEKIEHFIGGRHVPSVSGGTFDVADPVSNQVYAQACAYTWFDTGSATSNVPPLTLGTWRPPMKCSIFSGSDGFSIFIPYSPLLRAEPHGMAPVSSPGRSRAACQDS